MYTYGDHSSRSLYFLQDVIKGFVQIADDLSNLKYN